MRNKEFKTQLRNLFHQFLRGSISAKRFSEFYEDMFVEHIPDDLVDELADPMKEFMVHVALYVPEEETRKEEPAYIDEIELQREAKIFLERHGKLLADPGSD